MSYSYMDPCYNCRKSKTEIDGVVNENPCKDSEKIRTAINDIHMSTDGSHQGSGTVVLSCAKIWPINE